MVKPQPKPGMSGNPLVAVVIGACSVGLLAFGAWRVAGGNRDWWMMAVDGILGASGIWYAIEVFRERGKRPRSGA